MRRWSRTCQIAALLLILSCGNDAGEKTAWARRASMEIPRSEMPAVVLADEVWVLGGLTDNVLGFSGSNVVEVYDPNSDSWRKGPDLPEARHHAMAAVVGEDLYLIGGMVGDSFKPSASVWRFRADVWEPMPPLPTATAAGAAVVLDGSIYLIGGVPDGASVIRYDPETGEWTEVASLAAAREHIAAAIQGGLIYVAGGRWNGQMLSTVEVYDPSTQQWRAGAALAEARSGFALVALADGMVALGGEIFEPTRSLASVEVLTDNAWRAGTELPEGLHGVPAVVIDGMLYVLGGSRQAGDVDNAGEAWRIAVSDLTQ